MFAVERTFRILGVMRQWTISLSLLLHATLRIGGFTVGPGHGALGVKLDMASVTASTHNSETLGLVPTTCRVLNVGDGNMGLEELPGNICHQILPLPEKITTPGMPSKVRRQDDRRHAGKRPLPFVEQPCGCKTQ